MVAKTDPAPVLSPSQVRCFLDCPARWWFKYGLQLPERKNSSLALGLAAHQALEVNFREKVETQEDLETVGVEMVFREAWRCGAVWTCWTWKAADRFQNGIAPAILCLAGPRIPISHLPADHSRRKR